MGGRGFRWRWDKVWGNHSKVDTLSLPLFHQPHHSVEPLPPFFACRQVASTVHQITGQRSHGLFSFMPSLWFTVCAAYKVKRPGQEGRFAFTIRSFTTSRHSRKLQNDIKNVQLRVSWCLHPVMGGKQSKNIHFSAAYLAGCYAQLLFTALFAALINHAQHIRPFVTHFCESDNFQSKQPELTAAQFRHRCRQNS